MRSTGGAPQLAAVVFEEAQPEDVPAEAAAARRVRGRVARRRHRDPRVGVVAQAVLRVHLRRGARADGPAVLHGAVGGSRSACMRNVINSKLENKEEPWTR